MKVLVIGPSWVGDMMMSQSLYKTLKRADPGAEIDVMAPNWCRPLLARMPEVNEAITMPIGHGALALGERYRLGKHLRDRGYQQAYVLPNSFKSALIPFFAKIPVRIGWKGEMRYGLLTDLRYLNRCAFPLMVERYVALGYPAALHSLADLPQPIPWPSLQVSEEEVVEVVATFNLIVQRPIIGFCPGAEFGPAKRWPHYHYAVLAHHLIAQGYQIILFGSAKDQADGEVICQALDETQRQYCLNLAGKTKLDQAVLLLAACQGVVTNDSGLMHVAAALNKPLVALYGPSSPDFTPPLSHNAKVIRLITGYHKVRTGNDSQGYHQSLIDIQPDNVMQALLEQLAKDTSLS